MRVFEEDKEPLPSNMFRERNGVLYARLKVKGREIKRSLRTTNLRKAKATLESLLPTLRQNQGAEERAMPNVAEWWEVYQATFPKSARTQKRDEQIMAHALPHFGRWLLDRVTPSHCQLYLTRRANEIRVVERNVERTIDGKKTIVKEKVRKRVAGGTILRERNLLQALFERAVEDGLIQKNPWRGVKRGKFDTKKRVLTLDEQERLELVCTPWFRSWLFFMLGTGLRLDECRGIRPEHFNWDVQTVMVTGKGNKTREVPMLGGVDVLAREQLDTEGHLWPEDPSLFRKELDRYAKVAGIPHLSPHTLRHTFATRYLQGGGDIYILSKILGHASVKTTEEVYAHLLKEDLVARSAGVNLALTSRGKVLHFSPKSAGGTT